MNAFDYTYDLASAACFTTVMLRFAISKEFEALCILNLNKM